MGIKHEKNLAVADSGNPNEVQASDWNREHVVDGLLGALLNLGVATDCVPYLNGAASGQLAPLSVFMRGLLASANAAALLASLNVVSKAGDVMDGALTMSGHKVTGLGAPTDLSDAATKAYVDAVAAVMSGALVFKGVWDASTGAFPSAAGIKTGWFYKVSEPGTVDGVGFDAGDEIFAVTDDPSSEEYDGNWLRIEGVVTAEEIAAVLGFAFGDAAAKNVGTSAGDVVGLDAGGKLPAVDGSQLTNLPVGFSGQYSDLSGKPTLGGAASKDVGVANGVAALDANNRLVGDGRNLTNLPSSDPPSDRVTGVRLAYAGFAGIKNNGGSGDMGDFYAGAVVTGNSGYLDGTYGVMSLGFRCRYLQIYTPAAGWQTVAFA